MNGPDLPEAFDWPVRTQEWWLVWRLAPQSDLFEATDWDFLLDTALIHADFWSGNTAMAGELRARTARLGATIEDRARLKIAKETAEVVSDADEIAARRAARRTSPTGASRATRQG